MKRFSILFALWLGISALGAASTGSQTMPVANPASVFLGGCGLILVTMVRLTLKTRRSSK